MIFGKDKSFKYQALTPFFSLVLCQICNVTIIVLLQKFQSPLRFKENFLINNNAL